METGEIKTSKEAEKDILQTCNNNFEQQREMLCYGN